MAGERDILIRMVWVRLGVRMRRTIMWVGEVFWILFSFLKISTFVWSHWNSVPLLTNLAIFLERGGWLSNTSHEEIYTRI